MTPAPKNPDSSGLRSAGLLLAIPTILIVSPLVGFFVGMYADRWLGTGKWLAVIGTFLGFAAGGRETWQIYRRYQQETEDQDTNRR
jgi:F0F1-type ATP synthase assembly protein I